MRNPARNLITNISARQCMSLNGPWRYITDPYGSGDTGHDGKPSRHQFYRNLAQKDTPYPLDYNFAASGTLKVPGDWNSQKERLFFYEGTVWYQKDFRCRKKQGKRIFIHFGASNYHTWVFVNGRFAGEHAGGFTPFQFDITDLIKAGGNFVVVKVDNRRHVDGVPALMNDWWNYGGITRGVCLVETGRAFVRDYLVQLAPGRLDRISGWVALGGMPGQNRKVTLEIPALRVRTTVLCGKNGLGRFSVGARPVLWSPERPRLYRVAVRYGNETLTDRVGFRSLDVRGSKIFLNGRPVFLRGISIHEEAPFKPSRACSARDCRTLLSWAKDMGCNFVRLAHYTHTEDMVRLADQMGLLVWAEVPVYWGIRWQNPETFRNAQDQLAAMITRDRNRASVALWSIANETPASPARTRFLAGLARAVRGLDRTRPVTAALNTVRLTGGGRVMMISDPLGKHIDVIGCNQYRGWYDGLRGRRIREVAWKSRFNKPVIMSEFGAGARKGLHGPKSRMWTEEYQAEVYRQQIAMLKKIPFLAGLSPWLLKDFLAARRMQAGVQDYFNRKGLFSEKGEKKKAYFVLRKYYQEIIKQEKELKA